MWPRRGELAVLRGADFDVGAGEVVGLVGENGSGKSTLMKILIGALEADSGNIKVTGRMGYCPQEPVLYDHLTCEEHLEHPTCIPGSRRYRCATKQSYKPDMTILRANTRTNR